MTIARDLHTGAVLGQVINFPGLNPTALVQILGRDGKTITVERRTVKLESA